MAEAQTATVDARNQATTGETGTTSVLDRVLQKIRKVKLDRSARRSDPIAEADVRREVNEDLKEELRKTTQTAKDLSKDLDLSRDQARPDNARQMEQVKQVVQAYLEAAEMGLVIPPAQDEATQIMFNAVVTKLSEQGVSQRTATRFQPLLNGLVNGTGYLRFSKEGEDPTQFEQDMQNILMSKETSFILQDIISPLIAQKKLGEDMTIEKFRKKLEKLQKERETQVLPATEQVKRYNRRLRESFESQIRPIGERIRSIQNDIANIQSSTMSDSEKQSALTPLRIQEAALQTEHDALESRNQVVLDYLEKNAVRPPFTTEGEVRTFLKEMGFTEREIEEMKRSFSENESYRSMASEQRLGGGYTGYEDLGRKIMADYSESIIQDRLFKNGKLDYDALNKLQADLEDEVGVLFQNLYNSPKSEFSESFSPYSEHQMLRNIVQHLRTTVDSLTDSFSTDPEIKADLRNTLNNALIATLQRRPAIEQVVHQYLQIGATIDMEKLQEILKRYDISTLQEFYNDDLTHTMCDLMPQFIQKIQLENGNDVLTDLFQLVQVEKHVNKNLLAEGEDQTMNQLVVKYREECINYMYDAINITRSKLGKDKVSKANLNARWSRSFLESMLLSMRGVKVMSRAKPMRGAFGDQPWGNVIGGMFSPKHNWGIIGERGVAHDRAGVNEGYEVHVGRYMFNEMAMKEWIDAGKGDIYDEYHPQEEMARVKREFLYNMRPDNKELMERLRTGEHDVFMRMAQVYQGLGLGNATDQGGYTFDGLHEPGGTLDRIAQRMLGKSFGDLSGEEKLMFRSRTSGVVTAFWDAGGWADGDAMRQFWRYNARKQINAESRRVGRALTGKEMDDVASSYKSSLSEIEQNKLLDKYTVSNDRFKKIFNVTYGGKETGMSVREYRLHRENAVKGRIFHQLLKKDPLAWLGEMVQSYPELQQGYKTYEDKNGSKHIVRASQFYFDLQRIPDGSLTAAEKDARDRFRFDILTRFRGRAEEDYLSNVPHLQKIMDFHAKLIDSHLPPGVAIDRRAYNADTDSKIGGARGAAMNKLYTTLSSAHSLAVEREEAEIRKEDTIAYIDKGDGTKQEDRSILEALYNDDGLITHFENMVNQYPNYFGDGDTDLGAENGFYQRWAYSLKMDGRRPLPEGDTNMRRLYERVKNKEALRRKLESAMALQKAQAILASVPAKCREAGTASSFDEWYGKIVELHDELKVIADEDNTVEQEFQQQLYFAVCHYFSTDSYKNSFKGFLDAFLLKKAIGKDEAIVSIKADFPNRFMLDLDSRILYLKKLRESSYLKQNYDKLMGAGMGGVELAAGLSQFELWKNQIGFTVIAGAGIIIISAIQEGLKEVEGDN